MRSLVKKPSMHNKYVYNKLPEKKITSLFFSDSLLFTYLLCIVYCFYYFSTWIKHNSKKIFCLQKITKKKSKYTMVKKAH